MTMIFLLIDYKYCTCSCLVKTFCSMHPACITDDSLVVGDCAVTESGVVGDMHRAFEFGALGIQIMEKFPVQAKVWLAQIYTPHYALIVHWSRHTKETFKPLIESIHIGLESGAIEYAGR